MKRAFTENSIVLLLMLVVALVATWPLANHFFSAIPCQTTGSKVFLNRPGDSLQIFYWFWLLKDNLFGASGFMQNPYEFNMAAGVPPNGLYMYPFYFLYLVFSPLGEIAAYNSLVVCSYVLTGFFTYLLVKLYTGSRSGALVAAFIYTLVPIRVINLMGGHLNGFIYYLIPAILYFFEKALQSKRLSAAILCGLSIWWLSLLEVHLIYYICVFLGGYIPVRLFFIPLPDEQFSKPAIEFTASSEGALCRVGRKWLPLAALYGIGIVLTVMYQTWAVQKFFVPFFSSDFWIIFALYPVLFLFLMLLISVLLASASLVPLSAAVSFFARALAPLSLLPLYHLRKFIDTGSLKVIVGGMVLLLLPISTWFAWRRCLKGGEWQLHRFRILQERLLLPVLAGLGLSVGWVMLVKKVFFAGSIAHGGRTIQDVQLFSPHLAELYTRGTDVYLGLVPLFLITYALLILVRQLLRRDAFYSARDLVFLSFFSFSFLFAYLLGSGLSFGSSSLYILFFKYFPFFNYPRVPGRIMSIAFLCGAVVSGFAVRDMQKRFKGSIPNRAMAGFVLLLIFTLWSDFGAGRPVALTNLDRGQDIYRYIQKNIDDRLLLEIPLWPGDSHQSSLYEYYVTLDQIRRVNGYTPIVTQQYIDNVYKPLSTINKGLLDHSQYQLLQKMGVRFITVHDNPDVFPGRVSPFPPLMTVRRLMISPYLEYVPIKNMIMLPGLERENRDLYLFRVRDKVLVEKPAQKPAACRLIIPRIYRASRLSHITGRLVLDKSIKQKVLHAAVAKDKAHFLSYGPYVELPAGRYQVYFRLRTNRPGIRKEIVRLDVATYVGHREQLVLAARTISGQDFKGKEYQDFSIQFTVQALQRMEYRTWFSGNGAVWLEKVVITCAGQDQPAASYEAEMLLGDTGFLAQDSLASGKKAVSADVIRDKKGRMVYGPFRKYPAGRYRVTYIMKTDSVESVDPAMSTVAELSIRTDDGKTVLGRRAVRLEEIRGRTYKAVAVDMTLKRENEVSFNVYFNRQANILVDRIEIEYLGRAEIKALPFLIILRGEHAKESAEAGK